MLASASAICERENKTVRQYTCVAKILSFAFVISVLDLCCSGVENFVVNQRKLWLQSVEMLVKRQRKDYSHKLRSVSIHICRI